MVDGINFNPFTGKRLEQFQIDKMDTNKDGIVSAEELSANMSWLKSVSSQDEEGKVDFTSDENGNDKNLKFRDVYNELRANVPDRTTTIEEKELALKYIDQMLSCDDIPVDAKTFWTYNKEIIKAEILAIQNQNSVKNEKFDDVIKMLNQFADNYRQNEPREFLSVDDRINYWTTYNNTCISFYERALKTADITDEMKNYCLTQISYHKRDNNYFLRDLNNYRKENGKKTESFEEVFKEFDRNVPDSTTTIPEKELAISYIDRMLSCDDIPADKKAYWENKKQNILAEIDGLKEKNSSKNE